MEQSQRTCSFGSMLRFAPLTMASTSFFRLVLRSGLRVDVYWLRKWSSSLVMSAQRSRTTSSEGARLRGQTSSLSRLRSLPLSPLRLLLQQRVVLLPLLDLRVACLQLVRHGCRRRRHGYLRNEASTLHCGWCQLVACANGVAFQAPSCEAMSAQICQLDSESWRVCDIFGQVDRFMCWCLLLFMNEPRCWGPLVFR